MPMKALITLAALSASLTGAAIAEDSASTAAEELAAIYAGSFTSMEQCAIEGWGCVESEIVRVWPEREDGVWLYQENAWLGDDPGSADPAAKERPYFQRFVRLVSAGEGRVVRTVYSMTDPASSAGAYADVSVLSHEQVADANCSGVVERIAAGYWYADFPTCPGGLRGAVRTHSRSIHTPDSFANWDRGFDAEGGVVWGPSESGYVFKRVE
ncbi:chromophore lyase CpcT/CpeT [Maricaulaceae bacterium MS644]